MIGSNIGVCCWCLDREDIVRSIEVAGREFAVDLVQIGFLSRSAVHTADPTAIINAAERSEITVAGTFVAFEGEDYSSIDRIAETGGFGPGDLFPERLAMTRAVSDATAAIGARFLGMHVGTIPADGGSAAFESLLNRTRDAADLLGRHGLRLLLETGREPIDRLMAFRDALERENVGVSFDPGNLIIYGTDDPTQALIKLKNRIDVVHLKDAMCSSQPGVTFGSPAALGGGDARIARIVSKLRATGYSGPLFVECSASQASIDTVRTAVEFLRSMLS